MTFHIYFPPSPSPSHKFPVLYWLSGLTCSDENCIAKSGAQRAAASEGVALIAPDTSPRGLGVEGEVDSWDFGVGAGFYLTLTQEKWKNWRMYDYAVKKLPKVLSENFEQIDTSRASISGHSMGGHGALTIYLKNLDKYKSVSAFAPIVNPINTSIGIQKNTMKMKLLLSLLMFFFISSPMVMEYRRGGNEEYRGEKQDMFILHESEQVVKTRGQVRVVRGWNRGQSGAGRQGFIHQNPMHIGFITMEPKTLFIPQYIDSSLIMFFRRGGSLKEHVGKHEQHMKSVENEYFFGGFNNKI